MVGTLKHFTTDLSGAAYLPTVDLNTMKQAQYFTFAFGEAQRQTLISH